MPLSHLTRPLSVLALAAIAAGCGAPDPNDEQLGSRDEALTAQTGFGSNPGGLNMYTYVPAGVPAGAPLVVVLHGCSQTAQDYVNAGWNQLADQWKFYVVYAEQTTSNNGARCFRWYDATQTKRGGGEVLSVKQMVDWMESHYSVDASRVFATGLSAGAGLSVALLAAYPDVFAAGAPMAGLPYGCDTSCMNGVDRTPSAWGDAARANMPAGTTHFPRISIWQGTSDALVSPKNLQELVDQWTNVNGIDTVADATTTSDGGATHAEYRDASGKTLVESYSIPKMGHGTAVNPSAGCGTAGAFILDAKICSSYYAGLFFGLGSGGSGSSSASSGAGGGSSSSASSSSSGTGGAGGGSTSSTSASSSSSAGSSSASSSSGGGTCSEYYDANYYHVSKGRAVRCGIGGSYVCAAGSGAQFGLYTLMYSWLREPTPGYYEPGRCP